MGDHLLEQRSLGALRDGAGVELFDHELACVLAGLANKDVPVLAALFAVPAVLVGDRGVGGHDVDHLKVVSLTDHVVVWIVRGRDLEEPGGHLRLRVALLAAVFDGEDDIVVLDDGNDPPDDGQHDMHPPHRAGARVLRVHGHARVAHVGLGSGRRDGDPRLLVVGVVLRVGVSARCELAPSDGDGGVALDFFDQRVAEVVEVPVNLLHLDLVVRERGLRDRVPVDQALAAMDQPVLEKLEERLPYRPGADVVHREALAFPITRAPHRLQLVGDAGFELVLELLDELDELLASVPAREFFLLVLSDPVLALLLEAFVDHGLGRDPRVIGAGHPEGLVPLHAVGADKDVLEGVVERVPEMEGGGDIGRGDEDGIGGGLAVKDALGIGAESARIDPFLPDA